LQEQLAQLQAEVDSQRHLVATLIAERDANAAAVQALQHETDRTVEQLTLWPQGNIAGSSTPALVAVDSATAADQSEGNEAVNAGQMTIQEIKEWLTDHGFEDDVWSLTNRKTPRVKKDDWLQLIRSKQ
jgi:hypothetical protein